MGGNIKIRFFVLNLNAGIQVGNNAKMRFQIKGLDYVKLSEI